MAPLQATSDGGDEAVVRRMDLSQEQLRSEKRRIMKNVVFISFAFLLLFTAFQSMAALQSSINKVGLVTSTGCPIWSSIWCGSLNLYAACGPIVAWLKQLGSQIRWWNAKIEFNSTLVHDKMGHPVVNEVHVGRNR